MTVMLFLEIADMLKQLTKVQTLIPEWTPYIRKWWLYFPYIGGHGTNCLKNVLANFSANRQKIIIKEQMQ